MTKTKRKSTLIRLFTVFVAIMLAVAAILPLSVSARPFASATPAVTETDDAAVTPSNEFDRDEMVSQELPEDARRLPKADEKVTVIISVEGTPMMQYSSERGMSVAQALKTSEGRRNLAELETLRAAAYADVAKYITEYRYEYSTVINGFSAIIRYRDIDKVSAGKYVKNAILSNDYMKPEAVTENYVDVYETGIFNSSSVGYDGTGTIAAVLDTGTDYTHEAFDMVLDPATIAVGKDDVAAVVPYLAATSFSASKDEVIDEDDLYLNNKLPFAYDYADKDANVYPYESHGTHVAGIIAGESDTITGVAPRAQIATFKVFPDSDDGAKSEGIIAALNDAVALGVDVINMSLGTSCGFSREGDDDAINEVYDSINAAGICLVVAASNSYSSAQNSTWGNTNLASNPDSGTIGSPATYPASLAVASVSGVKTKYFTVNGKEIYFADSRLAGKVDPNDFVAGLLGDKEEGEFEYAVIPGIGLSVNYTGIDVNGKIAVVRRGSTSFEEKVRVAHSKGAIAVIVYNNISGSVTMSVGTKELIPSCFVNMELAQALLENEVGTIKLSKQYLAGPFMSDFSSWGVLPDLELSPDITAHGGEILSAVAGGNLYDKLSGTSMACPNLAGALILIRQYVKENHPEYTTTQVRDESYSRMMSTATIVRNEEGNPYSPRKQGAGLADLAGSVNTRAYITVDGSNKPKLSLGDDKARTGEYTLKFNVVNTSGSALSYKISPQVMTETMSVDERTVAEKAYMFDDTTSTYAVEARQGSAYMKGNVLSMTGYAEAAVTVTIKLSAADKKYLDANFKNGMYVEGYIRLLGYNKDNIDLNLPFLAFYGDWTDAPMLDTTAYAVGESAADDSVLAEDKLLADVYGTLPLAGFNSEKATDGIGTLGMGSFAFIPASGYEAPEPQEKFAALTTNTEGCYMFYAVSAGLLRGAKKVDMEIRNSATGDLLWSGTDYNARKSYASGEQVGGYIPVELDISKLGLANNAKYTFSMQCYLDVKDENGEYTYGNNNKFSFEFTIDNEAPQLVRASVREVESNGSKSQYLDLTVYDNHYIQGFSLNTYTAIINDEEFEEYTELTDGIIPIESEYRGNTTISMNISQYWDRIVQNDYKLYLNLYDYAANGRGFEIKLDKETDLKIEKKRTARDSYSIATNGQLDLKDYITVKANPDESITEDGDKSYVEDYWYKDLVWTSSDPDVVEVRDGLITGIKPSTESVNVSVRVDGKDDSDKDSPFCLNFKITVTSQTETIKVSGVKMSVNSLALERGETAELTAEVEPYNYTDDYELEWSSTSANLTVIPTDDQHKVIVKAINSGAATVRVTIKGTRISGYCSVYVLQEYTMYESIYLRSYTGRGDENGVVDIPGDMGITYIYDRAFFGNKYVKKVIIPEGVMNIMEGAFALCEELEEVVLPSTIERIDRLAFYNCPKLKKVNFEKVKSIGEAAFYNDTSLDGLALETCTFIAPSAFMYCESISSLDLTRVGIVSGGAFAFCTSLTELTIPKNTSLTTTVLTYGEEGEEQTEIEVGAFFGCTSLKELTVESDTVGVLAFTMCEALEKVTFVNDMTLIGKNAFTACASLKEVNFLGSVYKIDDQAFSECDSLTSVTLPAGLTVMGVAPFNYTGLREVNISRNALLTDLDFATFFNKTNAITAFNVEEGNPNLVSVDGVLYDKDMVKLVAYPCGRQATSFTVPASVKAIGKSAFYGSSYLRSVNLGSVEYIDETAFTECTVLTAVTSFDDLKYIGAAAFSTTALASLPLTDAVEYIGDEAFANCTLLTSNFVAPKNLKYLGRVAFLNAGSALLGGNLRSVSFAGCSLKEVGEGAFSGCSLLTTVNFGSLERISDYMFEACTSLTSVVIPETIKSIGKGAFYGCSSLSDVKLGTLEVIADMAFAKTAIAEIELPSQTKELGAYAFSESKITDIDLKNVKILGEGALSLTPIFTVSSDKVVSIGDSAFGACESLEFASFQNATTVGANAFAGDVALRGVVLGKAKTIGDGAFSDCAALTSIKLEAAEKVGDGAFSGCEKLASAELPALVSLGGKAFEGAAITGFALSDKASEVADDSFSGAEKLESITVAKENTRFFAEHGVLYGVNANGFYTLMCYPAAKADGAYTVLDKTIRLGANSFCANKNITKLVLPAHMQIIGRDALDGTTSLIELVIYAPGALTLESGADFDRVPQSSYNNFGVPNEALKIIIPSNSNGYDARTWEQYVGENVTVDKTALHIADGTLNLIYRIENIRDAENKTAEIAALKRLYGMLNSAQRAFVDGDYSYSAGGASIDKEYYGALLGGKNYYEILLDFEKNLPPETPDTPPTDPSEHKGVSMIAVIVVVCVLVTAGGALIAVIIRRRSQDE